MVNIQNTCSLDISFDTKDQTIHYGDGIYPSVTHKVTLQNLIPTLLNKALLYPEIVYIEHKQVFHETDRNITNDGISFDLIIIPPGLLGIEYIKTHIYYSPIDKTFDTYSTVVEVHFGILTIIMQKNCPKCELDYDSSVEEGLVVKLKQGEKLAIPAGYYYTFINTENDPVLFVRVYKKNGTIDYSFLKRENGLAYYCIRKNARQEIVHNPLYREVPQIRSIRPNTFIEEIGLCTEEALYNQLKQKTKLFIELLWG